MPGLDHYPKDRVSQGYDKGEVKSGLKDGPIDGKELMKTGRPSQDADDNDPK